MLISFRKVIDKLAKCCYYRDVISKTVTERGRFNV
nr:MAG TPA: hypothetical protein [Caudoviricetes sp.]